jgi:hypothetical protein
MYIFIVPSARSGWWQLTAPLCHVCFPPFASIALLDAKIGAERGGPPQAGDEESADRLVGRRDGSYSGRGMLLGGIDNKDS